MNCSHAIHLDLDGGWSHESVCSAIPGMRRFDATVWGPKLRFTASPREIEAFDEEVRRSLPPFVLYGSGDFHHLAALWIRSQCEPFTLVSFDNHPDWDTRPPLWCCGSWLSRAIELPNLRRASIWGPGNFELEWPHRMFANKRGILSGKLEVHPWGERLTRRSLGRWAHIRRETWREKFTEFAASVAGERLYVTVDMDCLVPEDAATNWENGLFTAQDIVWALETLNASGRIVAGDLCGAYSDPQYARFLQRLTATIDHPQINPIPRAEAARRNLRSLETIWPALTSKATVSAANHASS